MRRILKTFRIEDRERTAESGIVKTRHFHMNKLTGDYGGGDLRSRKNQCAVAWRGILV